MNIQKVDTKNHHCELPGAPSNIVGDFIDSGLFVNLRRTLKKLTMISSKHPYTKYYACSIRNLRSERKRHLVNYYNMIHPLSLFNFYFDIFMATLLLGTFIMAPILTPVLDPQKMQRLMSFKNFMHLVLVIVSCCTGYYDVINNKVELKRRHVILRYLRTYFVVDMAGILPTVIRILMNYNIINPNEGASKYINPALIFIMYGRYFYCIKILEQVKLATHLSIYIYKFILFVLHFLVFILLTMYILYYSLIEIPTFSNYSFIDIAEFTLTMLLLVNYGNGNSGYFVDILCPVVIIPFGFLLHIILFIQMMKLWNHFSSTENKQTTVYNSINAYMRYKALPMTMRRRILLFLDFKYQGHFYKDTIIAKATSPSLREEILMEASITSTMKVDLFRKLPEYVMQKLRGHMVSEIYLPGDIIIKAGQTGTCMFFILAGTVRVSTPDDDTICYLRDGSHFGEVALVSNIARVANVVAESPCELLKLNRKFFLEVVKGYPSLMREMKDMAATRMIGTFLSKPIEAPRTLSHKVHIADDPEIREFEIVGESSDVEHDKIE